MSEEALEQGSPLRDYVEGSAMTALVEEFDSLATGRNQIPARPVRSTVRDRVHDRALLDYQDMMTERSGPLFRHFLASVPGILEEMSRVGTVLSRLAERWSEQEGRGLTFYEGDAFDGTNGRTLAAVSRGRITTLTSSPNRANEPWFRTFADPAVSRYFPGSLFELTTDVLRGSEEYRPFRDGVDFFYETAAFQFYGRDRDRQVAHVADFLRPDGIAFFLEKLDHPDPAEYERREDVKDGVHKALYFSPEEIEWKRGRMLSRMSDGQVTLEELAGVLGRFFDHVFLIWNGTNFYEVAASNSAGRLREFLEVSGQPVIPDQFCCETPVVRRIGGRQQEEEPWQTT
ncbi:hypothetical protein [Actinorugispora endophytica]|uniref:Class I SAM-dependent methyltransferase n=1 Tax=Actinorugispora endophytica TaxID=1605990 RepID=A0A4R6V0G4_9ACTN|nr:hypothetical protein [Actinorugispora endophytica]TDQ53282.1 hypothetical protein EV190_10471 [Actinorugispora endophytica]